LSTSVQPPIQNKILAALPAAEYERLRAHLTPVSLEPGATLYNQGGHIKYVYFVNTGVVSHVTHMEDGGSVEVGLVGREGWSVARGRGGDGYFGDICRLREGARTYTTLRAAADLYISGGSFVLYNVPSSNTVP
jgi:CRP-like cAMP-binding protein